MWKIHTIYKISSKTCKREYVGSAIHFPKRKSEHLRDLVNNKHHSVKLQRHYNKYGKDDLIFSIIELVMFPEDLIPHEQYWINKLKPYFNILKVAGSNFGHKASKETKELMSKQRKGRKMPPRTKEHMDKIREANKNRKVSPESIEKAKETNRKNGGTENGGWRHTEEFKQSVSKRQKGKVVSKESIEKRIETFKKNYKKENNPNLGKHYSEERKKKMSEYFKAHPPMYWKGKKRDSKTIKAMIVGLKRIVECPHCHKIGKSGGMRRHHFNNCKYKIK